MLLIKKGELRVYILSEEGKEITLYRLRSGDVGILSASCILNNITFDVHIDTESAADMLLIPSLLYRQLCEQNIYADNFTCRLAMDRFSDVMWAMEQILFMSFDRRLAVFLLDEAARTGSDTVSLTHEQIAKYMGSAERWSPACSNILSARRSWSSPGAGCASRTNENLKRLSEALLRYIPSSAPRPRGGAWYESGRWLYADGVGDGPHGQNSLPDHVVQGNAHHLGTPGDDLPVDVGGKAGPLNFFLTELTSRSDTLLEGRIKAQAKISPVSSSTV